MANYCNYSMRVQGKEEDVEEFITIIKSDYCYDKNGNCNVERHFWRVFDAYVVDDETVDGIRSVIIDGYCAWSVYSCMCDGKFTYQNDHPDWNGTTLQMESERLQLAIEVFSEEPGCCFMEHYVTVKGKYLVEEEYEWHEYCLSDFDGDIDALNKCCGTSFTAEDFKNEDYVSIGGIEWEFEDWL